MYIVTEQFVEKSQVRFWRQIKKNNREFHPALTGAQGRRGRFVSAEIALNSKNTQQQMVSNE